MNSSPSIPSSMYTSNPIPDYKWEFLPDDFTKYDLSFKIIVIGDSGVGKSCLTNKATKNTFEECYNATVGFEFFSFNLRMDNRVIKMQIWDTCGQELYRSLITNFYRNSSLAIVVYSITSEESFNNIDVWLKELKMHSNPDAKVFLIGNKIDLDKDRKITYDQGLQFTKEHGLDLFMESSAKTGINAQEIFIEAARILYADYMKYKGKKNEDKENEGNKEVIKKLNQNSDNIKVNACTC